VQAELVSYIVVERGTWSIDGRRFEAQKYVSTVTNSASNFAGESRIYGQAYSNPVVIGQVMTENDADWSVFWASGANFSDPASATALRTGKMVGEDPDQSRAAETVGFIVFESGHGQIAGIEFEALVGGATIEGVENSPPDLYSFATPFATSPQAAVVSVAGMNGLNGGWAQMHGPNPLTATRIALSIDEDQVGDAERVHLGEQVAVIAFGSVNQ
jgi:hypothetical protein